MSNHVFRAWTGEFMAYQGSPDLETQASFMHHYGGEELMLRTLWEDSQGRPIFEGDVLEHDDKEWTVRLDFDGWVCNAFGCPQLQLSEEIASNSNVLGNIYEGKTIQIKQEIVEEVQELADRYWRMNLVGGTFEAHLNKILDNYTIKRKP